jgi:DNA-binding transcriptional LysR family regulator
LQCISKGYSRMCFSVGEHGACDDSTMSWHASARDTHPLLAKDGGEQPTAAELLLLRCHSCRPNRGLVAPPHLRQEILPIANAGPSWKGHDAAAGNRELSSGTLAARALAAAGHCLGLESRLGNDRA